MIQTKDSILNIDPYIGGESALRDAGNAARLMSNENPFGLSPKAVEAYKEFTPYLHLYAQGDCRLLREALAEKYHLNAANIVCGNGSDELLGLLAHAYAGVGDEVLYSQHGFLVYPIVAKTVGAKPIAIPEHHLHTDLEAVLKAVTPKTKIIYLANPNNPTGSYITHAALVAFCERLPKTVLLVLDEAYAEYVDDADYAIGTKLVEQFPNVAVTRTFSKIYGMAALRLGWGYFSPAVADVLNRIRGPFNVNGGAQVAGIAALSDVEHIAKTKAHNTKWFSILRQKLPALGYPVVPSVANFFLMHTGEQTVKIYEHLLAHEIFVRRVKAYHLPEHLRVTIGSSEGLERLLAALGDR
jgi:histidinol-phosphate aminotransferase